MAFPLRSPRVRAGVTHNYAKPCRRPSLFFSILAGSARKRPPRVARRPRVDARRALLAVPARQDSEECLDVGVGAHVPKIGRASCRGRMYDAVGGGVLTHK